MQIEMGNRHHDGSPSFQMFLMKNSDILYCLFKVESVTTGYLSDSGEVLQVGRSQ